MRSADAICPTWLAAALVCYRCCVEVSALESGGAKPVVRRHAAIEVTASGETVQRWTPRHESDLHPQPEEVTSRATPEATLQRPMMKKAAPQELVPQKPNVGKSKQAMMTSSEVPHRFSRSTVIGIVIGGVLLGFLMLVFGLRKGVALCSRAADGAQPRDSAREVLCAGRFCYRYGLSTVWLSGLFGKAERPTASPHSCVSGVPAKLPVRQVRFDSGGAGLGMGRNCGPVGGRRVRFVLPSTDLVGGRSQALPALSRSTAAPSLQVSPATPHRQSPSSSLVEKLCEREQVSTSCIDEEPANAEKVIRHVGKPLDATSEVEPGGNKCVVDALADAADSFGGRRGSCCSAGTGETD